MATIKAFTDVSQSKKLVEILPIESADNVIVSFGDREGTKTIVMPKETLDVIRTPFSDIRNITPCWSLAALLEVLPLGLYDEFDNCDYELEINMIDKMSRYVRLGDIYHSQFPYDFEKDTLLDNIVESIIWLNDNNYFEL